MGVLELDTHTFDIFSEFPLRHGVFLRNGGKSLPPYDSLNVGYCVGDKKEHVQENIEKIKDALSMSTLSCGVQCHGSEIAYVDKEIPVGERMCDVLTTSQPEQGLMIKHADCQAAILYDPINHAVAGAHVGWRGSVQDVYSKTIAYMKARYGTKPQNLFVGISPSLGPESAEFIHYRKELPESFWDFQIKDHYFDFWEISRWQLTSCGVPSSHIEIASIDTFTDERCFSYRREKKTGRHATVVVIENPKKS